MRGVAVALFVTLAACRGAAPQKPGDRDIGHLVDSLRPIVERATGLAFKGPTRSAWQSRADLGVFLRTQGLKELTPERQEGIEAVYRLLGMIPDTLDIKAVQLAVLDEQVAGYYDPESRTLYGVGDAEPTTLRLTLAHELVHALQHHYLPVDSLLKSSGNADQQAAVHAVLEGHAMIGAILAVVPDRNALQQPGIWDAMREQARSAVAAAPAFARAPLVIREGMLFAYLNGAEFVHWWDSARAGRPLPTREELPRSTEQILHPDRYARGDAPVPVRFADGGDAPLFEDTLGELEIQVLATMLRGGGEVLTATPIGWGGDRVRVYRTPAGPALVWYTVWDEGESAERFLGGPGARLGTRSRAGYRTSVTRVAGAARPTIRVVIAPLAWARWGKVPAIRP